MAKSPWSCASFRQLLGHDRRMSFNFHAGPPPGEWMNDPNGLTFQDGRYRLWAQHSDAAPDFRRIGWGSWSSTDLLHWRWDGVTMPYHDGCSIYSGSVAATETGQIDAWFTRHDHASNWQTQHHAAGPDWQKTSGRLPPEGRNCRDPFVFFSAATRDWMMLIAEPCDWTDWSGETASRLTIWRSTDCRSWRQSGTIGPWHPPGVMWEVPALIDFGDVQALIVSLVDRRDEATRCSVRYWIGRFAGGDFSRNADFPPEGVLVDDGPDFYAAIPNLAFGWPDAERVIVGWASSWKTARSTMWPGEIHGGPASLPRTITYRNGRLHQRPVDAASALKPLMKAWRPGEATVIELSGIGARLTIGIAPDGQVSASRHATDAALIWRAAGSRCLTQPTDIEVFNDCGLTETFFTTEGVVLTAFVPGGKTTIL